MSRTFTFCLVGVLLLGVGSSWAQSLEDGLEAYKSKDYARAAAILRPLAEAGDADAQKEWGTLLYRGHGVAKDRAAALQWWMRCAAQANADCQYSTGFSFQFGKGTTRDLRAAADWYALAAEQGVSMAQYRLGTFYHHGAGGLAEDQTKAVEWLYKAALQGNRLAMTSLGLAAVQGWVGPEDDWRTGCQWFERAAKKRHPRGMFNYGTCLLSGVGAPNTPKDEVEGIAWTMIAAEARDKDATNSLEKYETLMSATLMQEGRKRAGEILGRTAKLSPPALSKPRPAIAAPNAPTTPTVVPKAAAPRPAVSAPAPHPAPAPEKPKLDVEDQELLKMLGRVDLGG